MKRAFVLTLLAVAVLAFAAPAQAASNSLTLDQPSPHYGDTIMFTSTYGGGNVKVWGVCIQGFGTNNPVVVFGTGLVDPGVMATTGVTLLSTPNEPWDGQAAVCEFQLIKIQGSKNIDLADTQFTVEP